MVQVKIKGERIEQNKNTTGFINNDNMEKNYQIMNYTIKTLKRNFKKQKYKCIYFTENESTTTLITE